MVTSDAAKELLESLNPKTGKWDLKDPTVLDEWWLRTESKLEADGVYTALKRTAAPSLAQVKTLYPSMSANDAKDKHTEVIEVYEKGCSMGYERLLDRIDLKKNTSAAAVIRRKFAPSRDGRGLYLYVLEAMDFSSPEQQEELKASYDAFKLTISDPTPAQLSKFMNFLQ